MSANINPIFKIVPNIGFARLTAANTARDGSGSLSTCFTAGANGSGVESITFTSAQASAAASSSMVGRIFITDTAGANPRLLREITIPTVTASNTVIGATQTIYFVVLPISGITNGLFIPSGTLLKAAISVYAGVQDQMDVVVNGGDY